MPDTEVPANLVRVEVLKFTNLKFLLARCTSSRMKARMGSQIIPYTPGPAEMISIKFAFVRHA
jgi:hypothetical protein